MVLDKLKAFLNQYKREPINPQVFNDTIATQTSWEPMVSGGSNFETKKMKIVSRERIEFVPTTGIYIFGLLFALIGGTVSTTFLFLLPQSEDLWMHIIIFLFGSIFVSVGLGTIYVSKKPIVFDKAQGYFWKSRKEPRELFNLHDQKNHIPFKNIYAIQIIDELVRGDKSSFYSYELNLVLKDATRVNVIDHGRLNKIRESAQTLSEFLNIPVWDATGENLKIQ